jgi:hypothetical protein
MKIDCNKIANIISKIKKNYSNKCFIYFQKQELLYNSTISDYELNSIEFGFNKSILFISDTHSCMRIRNLNKK